jgi:hypothetical protein
MEVTWAGASTINASKESWLSGRLDKTYATWVVSPRNVIDVTLASIVSRVPGTCARRPGGRSARKMSVRKIRIFTDG